jgi:hypothetical protein
MQNTVYTKEFNPKNFAQKVVTLMESATFYYSGLSYPNPKYTSLRYVGGQEGTGDQFLDT